MTERKLPDHPWQMAFFVSACRDFSFGAGAVWKEPNCWRTEAVSLGSYLVIIDAALFAISIVIRHHISILSRTNHRCTEMVTKSRQALADMQSECHWTMPTVTSTSRSRRSRLLRDIFSSSQAVLSKAFVYSRSTRSKAHVAGGAVAADSNAGGHRVQKL